MSREEAIELYQEYVKLLEDEIDEIVGYAYTHGWRSTRGDKGKELRSSIKYELLESEPEPGEFTTKDKEAIAQKIHAIYFPTCKDCTYIDKDWLVVTKVLMPIIDRLEAENKELFESIAQYGKEVIRLQAELKAKDEALRIAKWTLFGCLAEKDDPEYKNFNVDEIVMGAKVCEQALKGNPE